MNRTIHLLAAAAAMFIISALGIAPALAQGGGNAPSAMTTLNPKVPVDELELLLKPLTREELVVEVDAWRDLLKAKASQISDMEIQIKRAEGEEKGKLIEQATKFRDERTAIIDRMNASLAALTEKGGEVEQYEKYIAAVSGLTLDVKDTSAAWNTLIGWVMSPQGGIRWAVNLIWFVVLLVAFKFLANIVGAMTNRALTSTKVKMSDLLRDFVVSTLRRVVFLIGLIIALSMLEVNVGPLVAALGVIGFVVGFALQNTLNNFAAGFMILLYRPYDIGNVVSAGGVTGSVESMSLVSTTFKTPDNQIVVVPNGAIWGGVITNVTGSKTRRVDMTFGIGYGDDIAKAQSVLEDIVGNHPLVLKDPACVIKLHELADSSVNFICRPWVKTGDYWTVYWDLTRAVKDRFDAEGISIPFPQHDVHVHQMSAS